MVPVLVYVFLRVNIYTRTTTLTLLSNIAPTFSHLCLKANKVIDA